ncbi:MAG TPA: LysR family transcriptional regulator [Casimicrobiaceae bacterium]|nr:LysR family transcriptional regulator [Casimicrobiaceae bacterium]
MGATPTVSGLDLSLLQTFHAVHATGNVTRAAERLGVSQPTVSHALSRLRQAMHDPLFVRTQRGMAATPRGRRLAAAVEQALGTLDAALFEEEVYDPARSARTFRLHMSDIGETIFLPRLMARVARVAPGVRLEAFQLDDADILPAMESGRIDLALGYIPALTDVERQVLLHEQYVVVLRADHPLARQRPTRAALARLSYVLVRSHPATARAIDALGLRDRVRLTLPHFMVLPRILADTELAVIMPRRLSDAFRRLGRYTVWNTRGLPRFDVSVHWYRRYAQDAGNRWLRALIVELFGENLR